MIPPTQQVFNTPGRVITLFESGFPRSVSAECLVVRNFSGSALNTIFKKVDKFEGIDLQDEVLTQQ